MVRQAVPLQPQAPVATTPAPELPFGQHSAPMEPQVTVERAIPIEPQWQAVTPAPASPQQVDTVAQDGFLAEFNALTATASPDIPEETPTIVDIAPPAIIPSQPLSEESRRIIASTPSGIDTQRVRSPEPVIIRRTDPNAGVIPKVDVRAHEELGLKIEIRRPDESIQHYLEQGYDNLLNKRYAIAAGYYQEALRIQRKNEAALFGLATTYHRLHQKDEARQLYIELLEINPTHREGLNNFMALVSGESPADAIEALEQLETENPDFSPIPAQLGTLYNRIGDPRMAARKLARALNLSPDNVSYKYNLAVTLDKLGQAEQASDLYLELIEAHNQGATLPGDVNDLRNRVIFINQKG